MAAQIDILSDGDAYLDSGVAGPVTGSASALVELSPGGTPAARGESSARADYGSLRVILRGETTGGPELGAFGNFGLGNSAALFEDTVTIVAPRPELSGTEGRARVRVQVAGLLDADSGGALDANVDALYFAVVRFGPRNCGSTDPECSDSGTGRSRDLGSLSGGKSTEGELPPLDFETLPLRFLFDQPFTLGVELSASVSADADEELLTATALAIFGNTLEWDGFTEVRDGTGAVVDDYQIDSLTGIDWALPVPEPGGGAARLVALAVTAILPRLRGRCRGRCGRASPERVSA